VSYVDRSGRIESCLVGDGVTQLQWVVSEAVELTVVDVDWLNDGEALSTRNTVA